MTGCCSTAFSISQSGQARRDGWPRAQRHRPWHGPATPCRSRWRNDCSRKTRVFQERRCGLLVAHQAMHDLGAEDTLLKRRPCLGRKAHAVLHWRSLPLPPQLFLLGAQLSPDDIGGWQLCMGEQGEFGISQLPADIMRGSLTMLSSSPARTPSPKRLAAICAVSGRDAGSAIAKGLPVFFVRSVA